VKTFSQKNTFHWRRFYSNLLLLAVLTGVAAYVLHTFSEMPTFQYQLRVSALILSIFFLALTYPMSILIWMLIARGFGLKSSFFAAARIWSLSQLGKYLPGKAGLILMRLDAYPPGTKKSVLMATGVETIAALSSACLWVLIAMAFLPALIPLHVRYAAVAGIILFFFILYPPVLKKSANWFLKLLKRTPLQLLPDYKLMLSMIGVNMLIGLPYGLGLFFAFQSLHEISWTYFLTIMGAFYIADVVSIAAFFAPAGIGVREGIIFLILPTFIPKEIVVLAALMVRLASVIIEISLAAIIVLIGRYFSFKKNEWDRKG
jgi:glycosyltransferase 2 family protein